MANEAAEPQELETPEELLSPEGGSRYEKYKRDGVYEYGVLANGKRDKSRVKITYNVGDVFEGVLKRGRYTGAGKYLWQDGGIYEGNFKSGKPDGRGKYVSANGDSFAGDFKDNAFDGNGRYVWADGSYYEGSFKGGKLLSGRFTDASGNIYTCSYSYKRNGERKSGEVRLIKKGAPKAEDKPAATDKQTVKKRDDGLQNKDRVLITRIRQSAEGEKFKKLYSGEDKSVKAEEKLLKILGFFTNYDEAQMERIYKTSKLYAPSVDVRASIAAAKAKNSDFVKNASARAKSNAKTKTSQSAVGAIR